MDQISISVDEKGKVLHQDFDFDKWAQEAKDFARTMQSRSPGIRTRLLKRLPFTRSEKEVSDK